MNTQALGTCPVCNGSGHMPCPDEATRRYGVRDGWYGYRAEDDTVTCTNCGGQTMSGVATGKVLMNRDTGEPCKHEFVGRNAGRCYTIYVCKHCPTSFDIDSGD